MRVLGTGHQGYIGAALVPILRAGGHVVVGLEIALFAEGIMIPVPIPVGV